MYFHWLIGWCRTALLTIQHSVLISVKQNRFNVYFFQRLGRSFRLPGDKFFKNLGLISFGCLSRTWVSSLRFCWPNLVLFTLSWLWRCRWNFCRYYWIRFSFVNQRKFALQRRNNKSLTRSLNILVAVINWKNRKSFHRLQGVFVIVVFPFKLAEILILQKANEIDSRFSIRITRLEVILRGPCK